MESQESESQKLRNKLVEVLYENNKIILDRLYNKDSKLYEDFLETIINNTLKKVFLEGVSYGINKLDFEEICKTIKEKGIKI